MASSKVCGRQYNAAEKFIHSSLAYYAMYVCIRICVVRAMVSNSFTFTQAARVCILCTDQSSQHWRVIKQIYDNRINISSVYLILASHNFYPFTVCTDVAIESCVFSQRYINKQSGRQTATRKKNWIITLNAIFNSYFTTARICEAFVLSHIIFWTATQLLRAMTTRAGHYRLPHTRVENACMSTGTS